MFWVVSEYQIRRPSSRPASRFWQYHLLAGWPKPSYLTSCTTSANCSLDIKWEDTCKILFWAWPMVNVQYMAVVAIIISNNAGKSSIATRVLTFNFGFSDWKFLLALYFFSFSFILSSFLSSFPILFFLIFLLPFSSFENIRRTCSRRNPRCIKKYNSYFTKNKDKTTFNYQRTFHKYN